MKVMFCAEAMETNLMWEWCPGEGGVGSRVVGRDRMFCISAQFPKGPMAVQGDSRAAWAIFATSSTSCPFNKRLFYIGIFTSSFHAIYTPIRLGSSFTCIHAVSRQQG